MNAKEGIEAIKKILFGDDTPPVPPVAPVVLAVDPITAACQACIDAGVPEPCLSACQACVVDMSQENMKACIEACKALENDPVFGEVCKACISLMSPEIIADPAQPMDMNNQFTKDFAAFKVEFESHKQAFDQVKLDFAAANDKISKQDEAIKGLLTVVENLAKIEVAAPAQAPVDFENMTPLQKFRATK